MFLALTSLTVIALGLAMQATKLVDVLHKISTCAQQLDANLGSDMISQVQQLRQMLLAAIVQMLVPIGPVPDIFKAVIAPFRRVIPPNIRFAYIHLCKSCLTSPPCRETISYPACLKPCNQLI